MLTNNSQSDDLQVDEFFQTYRAACPDVEPGRNFMPNLWQRIEARQTFWFVFQRFAKTATAACGALCLLMLALNLYSPGQASMGSYTDALMAEHTAEKTYYTEAIRSAPDSNDVPDGYAVSPE